MKKLILMIAAVMTVFGMSAQSYRGFLELYGGIGMGDKHNFTAAGAEFRNFKPAYALGFSTIHGAQLAPCFFVGVGASAYGMLYSVESSVEDYYKETAALGINIPAYLDLRWDLDVRKKVSPFVDVKVGYQFAVNFNDCTLAEGTSYDSREYTYFKVKNVKGFYFMPTIGIRIRTNSKTGFNIGVSYLPKTECDLLVSTEGQYDYTTGIETPGKEVNLGKKKSGALMLNLGYDF